MTRLLIIIRILTILMILPSCGLRDGFKTSEYIGILSQSPNGSLDTTFPVSVATKNAKHITGYPSIFYMSLDVNGNGEQVVAWDHWLNQSEKCLVVSNADGNYELDCEENIGVLTIFLTFTNSEGENETIFETFDRYSEANQSEGDVFPDGR